MPYAPSPGGMCGRLSGHNATELEIRLTDDINDFIVGADVKASKTFIHDGDRLDISMDVEEQ